MRRGPPPRHAPPREPWYLRLRNASGRRPFSIGFLGIGPRTALYIEPPSNVIPEPDEELPDSYLSDQEQRAAIARERWRRHTSR